MPVESPTQESLPPVPAKGSYGQILASTALIGGASALNLVISVLRVKATAIILGPAGVGLSGIYGSIISVSEGVAGLGINNSGVRQIAEASGSGDEGRVAHTAGILRRTSLVLGVTGALALILFSRRISRLSFGDETQTYAVCILAFGLLFRLVNLGQGALLQGMRRVADVAKIGVFSALLGTLLTIPLVYFLREQGVAVAVTGGYAVSMGLSWWYSRRACPAAPSMSYSVVQAEVGALLKLGAAFMVSNLLMVGTGYAVRAEVFRLAGLEASGLYQAAWALGGMYTNFILQSMGSDFYPRLTAAGSNNAECNRLVNEQARVSLLLAGTGIIGVLTFAPIMVRIFYAASFAPSVGILRWICLGTAIQVISWPMGFILLARNARVFFLISDTLWAVAHIGLAWVGMQRFGLEGAGMGFLGSYLLHACCNYFLVSRLSGFRWSTENLKEGGIYISSITVAFGGFFVLPFGWAIGLGTAVAVGSGIYSLRTLVMLVSQENIPGRVRRILMRLGMLTPQASAGLVP